RRRKKSASARFASRSSPMAPQRFKLHSPTARCALSPRARKATQEDIVIDLTSGQSERLVFKRSGQQLVAREWDRAFWGAGGLRGRGRLHGDAQSDLLQAHRCCERKNLLHTEGEPFG